MLLSWMSFHQQNLVWEWIGSLVVFCLGKWIPDFLEQVYWNNIENNLVIPYQVTSNSGDVIMNLQLNQPLQDETVTSTMRVVLCVVLAWFILAVSCVGFHYCTKRNNPKSWKVSCIEDFACIASVWFFGCGVTVGITNLLKLYTVRLRPNFYNLCGFDMESLTCQASLDDIRNGMKSFPSGHASLAFASMTVLTCYFLGHTFQNAIQQDGNLNLKQDAFPLYSNLVLRHKLFAILSCLPLLLATWIATSRIHDYYHFASDVLAGSTLGFVCSYSSYTLWYPSMSTPWVGHPLMSLTRLLQEESTQDTKTTTMNRNDYVEFS